MTSKKLSFFFSRRRRHTRYIGDWSSDVCSSDLPRAERLRAAAASPGVRRLRRLGARDGGAERSEERRVGKECRTVRTRYDDKRHKKRKWVLQRHNQRCSAKNDDVERSGRPPIRR